MMHFVQFGIRNKKKPLSKWTQCQKAIGGTSINFSQSQEPTNQICIQKRNFVLMAIVLVNVVPGPAKELG
jgi:hypothetical protein